MSADIKLRIMGQIAAERANQDAKWGEQNHGDDTWFRILGEEFGEIAKALNEYDEQGRTTEIIQTLAVGVAWLEAIERRGVAEIKGPGLSVLTFEEADLECQLTGPDSSA